MGINKRHVRVALFGAAPDTPNMGVTALYMSVVLTLAKHFDSMEFVVFDNGLGRRKTVVVNDKGREIPIILFGARGGNRYYRAENLHTMLFLSRFGRLGVLINEGLNLIDSCDAVLDISGGDSFSDIYGLKRFDNINIPKVLAAKLNKKLILLPQTYGPFNDNKVRKKAQESTRNSTMAWARDKDSFKVLKALLADKFDEKKHHCGVDVAFLLQPKNAFEKLDSSLSNLLKNKEPERPLVGINVSGLIYNDPDGARINYGFKSDYKVVLVGFITKLLETTQARIVLIPHVMDKGDHYESDIKACYDLVKSIQNQDSQRLLVAPEMLNESEVKWLISKMDWFCGTRMHSTIAGLSSCVPTAAISYSDKTKGVFETCQQDQFVYDPRVLLEDDIIESLLNSFAIYKRTALTMPDYIGKVTALADAQMKKIASVLLPNKA